MSIYNGGWDTHSDNFTDLKNQLLPPWDQGLAALIEDLHERRLLEATRQLAIKTLARLATPQHTEIISALRESAEDDNFGVRSLAEQMLRKIETNE